MVVEQILNILREDEVIKEILKPTVTEGTIYPKGTSKKCNSLIYQYVPLTNDGIKAQSRLEIDCIHTDYEVAYMLFQAVQKVLLTVGDTAFNNQIMNIMQNGGGYVFEKELKLHIFKAIFILKERVR